MTKLYGTVQELVIITGVSGAGRRTAAHAMEDLGWFVVDNLPPVMLPELLTQAENNGIEKVTVVADVRSREQFAGLPDLLTELRSHHIESAVLYLDASDEIIVQRQESSRRPLPLQGDGRLTDGIQRERLLLAELRAQADIVIDTSRISASQLKARIANHYGTDHTERLHVAIMSFGFKNGLPIDSDYVFDVRFLPNPYWIPELRPKSGLATDVSDYVLSRPGAQDFLAAAEGMLQIAAPGYLREGKRQVTVAIGCTGGKHRSTALSVELSRQLQSNGFGVSVLHRDLGKE